jgi:hypothetical protein
MKKALLAILIILFNTSCACTCIHATEETNKEYGVLALAVTFSSDKIIGVYGRKMPDNLNAAEFTQVIEHKIPGNYYQALKKYKLEVDSKDTYYLLKAYDSKNHLLILFDYSCTSELDGPVYNNPQKYNATNLAQYDTCLIK